MCVPQSCSQSGIPSFHVGTWLSLVEHSLGVRGVGSSNLPVPTILRLWSKAPSLLKIARWKHYPSTQLLVPLIADSPQIKVRIPTMYAFRKTAIIGFSLIWGVLSCSAQSLGDAAREQQVLKKSNSSASKHLITNDDLHSGEHFTQDRAKPAVKTGDAAESKSAGASTDHLSADEVKAGIKAQRQKITQLEAQMDDLQKEMEAWKGSDCTHVLRPDNSNTCDIPQKLTAELDRTKGQLDQEKKNLKSMQEDARQMGYANSVYDPN